MTPTRIKNTHVIRTGESRDRAQLDVLLTAEEMQGHFPPDDLTVYEVDGIVAGAIRIEIMDGRAWIRPIVVGEGFQGQGVGSALINWTLAEHGRLYAVARGDALPFYERLGFESIEWTEVPGVLWSECNGCPDVDECKPVPLMLAQKTDA